VWNPEVVDYDIGRDEWLPYFKYVESVADSLEDNGEDPNLETYFSAEGGY
jgi:hypothetical protein